MSASFSAFGSRLVSNGTSLGQFGVGVWGWGVWGVWGVGPLLDLPPLSNSRVRSD